MKKVKLKHAVLCQIILLAPIIIFAIMGFVIFGYREDAIGGVSLFSFLILSLVYILKLFPILFTGDMLFSMIQYWKKDRLWFSADSIGSKPDEITELILGRVCRYGTPIEEYHAKTKPLYVRYKRCRSSTVFWSSIERIIIIYQVDSLNINTYSSIIDSYSQILSQIKCSKKPFLFQSKEERKAPVCRAAAIIIMAESADEEVIKKVRKLPNFETNAILPCIVDLNARRCYFDGMKDVYISGITGVPPKNIAINLVKKFVFAGRLPLKGNLNYDYSNMSKDMLEQPLFDFIKEFYQETKREKFLSRKISQTMKDGEIREKDDEIFIKRGERVASFLILENESDCLQICTDEYWSFPNHLKISKTVFADLKEQVREYYAQKNLNVEFLDETEN